MSRLFCVEEGPNLLDLTLRTELQPMSKTRENQIIGKYKEVFSNIYSHAEMGNIKFFFFGDGSVETERAGYGDVALGMGGKGAENNLTFLSMEDCHSMLYILTENMIYIWFTWKTAWT